MNQPQPPKPPPGWHDDGIGLRWWDGEAWTDIRPPSRGASQVKAGHPAGWYDQDDGRQRFFNGTDWTEAYQDPVRRRSRTEPRWWRTNRGVIVLLVALAAVLLLYQWLRTDEAAYEAGREWGREWSRVVVTASGDSQTPESLGFHCAQGYSSSGADHLDEYDWIEGCEAAYRETVREAGL